MFFFLSLQLRKPVSTLSIPGAIKSSSGGGGGTFGDEEAGIALVGVNVPDDKNPNKTPPSYLSRAKPNVGYRSVSRMSRAKPNVGYRSVSRMSRAKPNVGYRSVSRMSRVKPNVGYRSVSRVYRRHISL